jgi:hypothetical protein
MAQISFSGKRELRWLQEGETLITFIEADVAIADVLWDQWLAAVVAPPGQKRLLASWGDIQPTKDQWRRATRMIRDAKTKVAVVTESRATSALAKAASWAGADMQAFRWEQLYEASMFLNLDSARRMAVRTAVMGLRDCFGPVDEAAPRPAASPSAARPATSASPAARPSVGASAVTRPPAGASPVARPSAGASSVARPSTASPVARPASARPPASASAVARPPAGASSVARPVATPRPTASPSAPSSRPAASAPIRPTAAPGASSRTPMADAASKNLAQVRQTSEEIQAKLAEIQARLRNRKRG